MPSIYGSKSKGWQLRLDYTVKSQSIENNTSALDLTLYVYDGTGYSQNESANEAYYILQGTKLGIRTIIHLPVGINWA